jgi:hypothetical protein
MRLKKIGVVNDSSRMKKSFKEFIRCVSDYINCEYINNITQANDLTDNEKLMIRNIISEHY